MGRSMHQPQQNMTIINPKYFWIHRLVSAPGGTLLLVPIMTFFPRKSEREKRSNTQLERQVPSRTQIQYVTATSTNCNREVTYALWDSWSFSSSIDVPLEFSLSTEQHDAPGWNILNTNIAKTAVGLSTTSVGVYKHSAAPAAREAAVLTAR